MMYTKNIPVSERFDVIVCGAGVAGYCAAVQAARAGAKTALVEKYGMPGGILTVGGNPEIGLFFRGDRQIISGIGWETVQRLAADGWAAIPEFSSRLEHSQQNVSVNAPMMAALMDAICEEAGVTLLYHHTLCDALTQDGKITGVVVSTKTGLQILEGSVFIDATGDGDLSAFAGAEFLLGETPENPVLQPGTLRFYWSDVDNSIIQQKQVEEAFAYGLETGEVERADYWSLGGSPYTIFSANGNNINHIAFNAADSRSRAQAEVKGRRSVARLADWARHRVKGAEKGQPVACGMEVAARESRRVVGDHCITVEEYVGAAAYDDGICYSYYPVDLHAMGDTTLFQIAVSENAVPQIPLGALLVKGLDNLMVAGRCASGDRLAHSAFRVKASCMAMGQAVGAVAALAVSKNCSLRAVPLDETKALLVKNGALVP